MEVLYIYLGSYIFLEIIGYIKYSKVFTVFDFKNDGYDCIITLLLLPLLAIFELSNFIKKEKHER